MLGNYYLNHQSLISGSGGGEALWTIVGSLVVEHSPSNRVLSRPVHCPASVQVILPLQVPQGQIRAGGVELCHTDTASSSRYGHHTVVLYTRVIAKNILDYNNILKYNQCFTYCYILNNIHAIISQVISLRVSYEVPFCLELGLLTNKIK